MTRREGAFRQQLASAWPGVDEAHPTGAERQRGRPERGSVDERHGRDRLIVALAAGQHGVVTTAQLLGGGVSRGAIGRRVARGWLVPLYRGVYEVGPVAARYGREMAAVLACGKGAVLSYDSAAAIWGIRPSQPGDIHVTVPGQARRARPGIRVHRSLSLNAAVKDGLPLTDPARTLRDLKRVLPSHELDRAKEQAHVLGLVIPDDAPEPEFTRSEGERRLKALCKAAGLPIPRINALVAGWEVDAYWAAHNLVVEVDGWNFHSSRQAFERDRRKDAQLVTAGYRVVRITWRRLRYQSLSVSAQLGALLTPAR